MCRVAIAGSRAQRLNAFSGIGFFSSERSHPGTCSGNCHCPSYLSSVGALKTLLEVGSDQKPSLFQDARMHFKQDAR